MTTYFTNNPIGSSAVKDLYDNAQNLDDLLLGPSPSYLDRLGQRRQSWAGIETEFSEAMVGWESRFTDFLNSSGFELLGDYAPGLVFTEYNQVMIKDGELYGPKASTTLPYTTTGDWGTESVLFVARGDAVLRQELATPTGANLVGYAARNVKERLEDVVSVRDYITTAIDGVTSNQVGLEAAVAAAVATGASLHWPTGTYVSTANLVNFHQVRHTGAGIIKRGLDLFYVSPKAGQTNNIYVGNTAAPSNDGLSSSEPINAVQTALNALTNYGPVLDGIWNVNLAAGPYLEQVTFPIFLRGKERITIKGPAAGTPVAPTAIMEGSGTRSFGLNFNAGNNVVVQDIKFRNYLDFGLVAQDYNDIFMINPHFENITGGRGIGFHFQQGRCRVYGGKATNCGVAGASLISQVTTSISSLTNDVAGGFQVTNCPVGIACQEQVTGHVDYVTVTGGAIGLDLVIMTRINSSGCVITGQTEACMRARLSSQWLDNPGNTLTPGVGGVRTQYFFGSGEINEVNTAVQERRSIFDANPLTHTGTTTITQIKTYTSVVKANSFDWPGRKLRVVIRGQFAGGSGTKTLTCQLGSNLIFGLTSIVSSTGFFKFEGELNAVTASSQLYSAFMLDTATQNDPVSPCKGDVGARAYGLNTGLDLTLVINAQLQSSGDSIIISAVEIYETA